MLYLLRLYDCKWYARMLVHMDGATNHSLGAKCNMEPPEKVKFCIAGNCEPLQVSVELSIFQDYKPPKQSGMLRGRSPSTSLMELDPRPIGTVTYYSAEFTTDRSIQECLACNLCVGADMYDELRHRHRNGAQMPATIALLLDRLNDESSPDEVIWDTGLNRELPVVEVVMNSGGADM